MPNGLALALVLFNAANVLGEVKLHSWIPLK